MSVNLDSEPCATILFCTQIQADRTLVENLCLLVCLRRPMFLWALQGRRPQPPEEARDDP